MSHFKTILMKVDVLKKIYIYINCNYLIHFYGYYLCAESHASVLLKGPYYAFSNITFHAVCHVAVCMYICKILKPTVHDKFGSQSPKQVIRNSNLNLLRLYVMK